MQHSRTEHLGDPVIVEVLNAKGIGHCEGVLLVEDCGEQKEVPDVTVFADVPAFRVGLSFSCREDVEAYANSVLESARKTWPSPEDEPAVERETTKSLNTTAASKPKATEAEIGQILVARNARLVALLKELEAEYVVQFPSEWNSARRFVAFCEESLSRGLAEVDEAKTEQPVTKPAFDAVRHVLIKWKGVERAIIGLDAHGVPPEAVKDWYAKKDSGLPRDLTVRSLPYLQCPAAELSQL